MRKGKYAREPQVSYSNGLYWVVGILLIFTMLSVWLVSGLFAKFVTNDKREDSARVAGSGVVEFLLREHKANDASGFPDAFGGEYRLDLMKEVTKNEYEQVLPGVDIPKDPFISLNLENAEVDYKLYVKVIESKNFPDEEYVTYSLRDDWKFVGNDTYVYVGDGDDAFIFDAGTTYDRTGRNVIWILKDNKIEVKEHYVAEDNKPFKLTFEVWLQQVD